MRVQGVGAACGTVCVYVCGSEGVTLASKLGCNPISTDSSACLLQGKETGEMG